VSSLRDTVVGVVRQGVSELPEPLTLASGQRSRYFIDGKAAFARGTDLGLACRCLIETVREDGIEFDAVGGLTMGADAFAHGVAILLGDVEWFSVRKEPKGRGTNRWIEGARLGPDARVLLVDDVVTTGGSIEQAYEHVIGAGAAVVAAATLVDRDDRAGAFFKERGIPYFPLVTYRHLDIPAVSHENLVPA
jgi:orotate phosphoribosyltransferase